MRSETQHHQIHKNRKNGVNEGVLSIVPFGECSSSWLKAIKEFMQ